MLRKSGTEPLIKGPAEAADKDKANLIFALMREIATGSYEINQAQEELIIKIQPIETKKIKVQATEIKIKYS